MRNRIGFMQLAIASLFVTFLSMSESYAQGSYRGGEGGGYSTIAISNSSFVVSDSLNAEVFDVTVYPNPLRSNQVFRAKVVGVRNGEKVSVIISDLIGTRLLAETLEVTGELVIDIPYERLSKGIYLITFQHKERKITRRFSYAS